MIKVENIDVCGFEHAIRGMRNPKNSWHKSDSYDCGDDFDGGYAEYGLRGFSVGNDDLSLMKRLYKAGTEHRTYARMIQVSMDIVAPLYWWKEMDRYTIGKSQVSCSTMHKIAAKEFELDDFSCEHLTDETTNAYYKVEEGDVCISGVSAYAWMTETIAVLNAYRELYLDTKNKDYWWQLIQLLPSSYNQRRTVCMSYETVFKIIKERTGHKLDEWNDFVEILKQLPCVEEIIKE